MGEAYRGKGYCIQCFSGDHEPIHVHVHKAGKWVKLVCAGGEWRVARNGGMSPKMIKKARELCEENYAAVLREWQQSHSRR